MNYYHSGLRSTRLCFAMFIVGGGFAEAASCPTFSDTVGVVVKKGSIGAPRLLDLGVQDLGQKRSVVFNVCNESDKAVALDVFSYGQNIIAYWIGKEPASKTTRVSIAPREVRQIETTLKVSVSTDVPVVTISNHGKLQQSIFVGYLVSNQPSPLQLKTEIHHLQSGWINQENKPPYRICIDNPPPFYHLSPLRPPALNIVNPVESNGTSHPRNCGGQYASCKSSVAGDVVCYDVGVEGHAQYQTSIFGPGDQTDFVWFDLELIAWYDRIDDAPEWVVLDASNSKH